MNLITLLPLLLETLPLARTKPIRGVNLGGWLLAEKWMTPLLFSATGSDPVVDEWTFGYVPHAQELLTKHWDTFITESDFEEMSKAGINFVRIPLGYWAYGATSSEPYVYANQTAYLDRALDWAAQYNIGVMVDLHGVPGSQNGLANSGHKGAVAWQTSPEHAVRATDAIRTISSDVQGRAGYIGLVNEPVLDRTWIADIETYTKEYYQAAYPAASDGATAVMHDGFLPLTEWEGFLPGATLDTHVYAGMYTYRGMDPDTTPPAYDNITHPALRQICQLKQTLATSQTHHPTLVGEFTLAQTQTPRSRRTLQRARRATAEQIAYRKQLFDSQRAVYEENAAVWAVWSWKTDYDSPWSDRSGLKHGCIPWDLSRRGEAAVCYERTEGA